MKNKAILTQLPKTLIAITLLSVFASKVLYAHNSCDVELEAGLTINESKLEFFESEHKHNIYYSIDIDNNLSVGGEKIDLNATQQNLVTQYNNEIRNMVPQVRSIAIEGVDLALDSVGFVFNELLGEGNSVGDELINELSVLKEEVGERFTIEHGFTLGENGLEDDALFGEEIEERIESAVEKAVMGSMGSLLVALGQEMMFSGGDSDAFETKMETFGQNIEHEMELRAEKIERKANSLCLAALNIDNLEEQLKINISPLADINVITVKQNHSCGDHDVCDL